MSSSLVLFNCSPTVVDRIRNVLDDQVPTVVCGSWDEVCNVLNTDSHHSLVAESDQDAPTYTAATRRRTGATREGLSGTLADQIDQMERQIIEATLRKNQNHRKETAADLGISRVTLYNKMKKFGML